MKEMQSDIKTEKNIFSRFVSGFSEIIKNDKRVLYVIIGSIVIITAGLIVALASCSSDIHTEGDDEIVSAEILSVVEIETQTDEAYDSLLYEYQSGESGNYIVNLPEGKELNVRLIPSASSSDAKVITTIPTGTQIQIQFIYNNWGFTEYNDCAGWVSMDYLKEIK